MLVLLVLLVLLVVVGAQVFQLLARARCYCGHICSVCDIASFHSSCISLG